MKTLELRELIKGKTMRDMFNELFDSDANKIAYYFGIGEEK